MTAITASEARANLYRLIDEAASSHQPLLITGKRNKAVLVSEEDWEAIQETLYLLSIPGMRESIREGMARPVGDLSGAYSRRINIQHRLVYQCSRKAGWLKFSGSGVTTNSPGQFVTRRVMGRSDR